MTQKELAIHLARAADKKLAVDIRILHVEQLTTLAEYFVIATCTSSTHLKALSDEMELLMKRDGHPPHHIEGYLSGSWILMDFTGVIVHLFTKETRDFYSLERLWSDAQEISFDEGGES